jgi:nucleoside-diphosphate-sugar epimerase
VGQAVLDAFVRAGHRVDALVRNRERAAMVQARGARPILGNLSEPSSYADAAASADGTIHAALDATARAKDVDAVVIETLVRAGAAGRFVIYTSDIRVLGNQPVPADETTAPDPPSIANWRPAHERRVLHAAATGLRTAVVRPGLVYGGTRGVVSDLLRDAANGLVRIVGTGENHWPLVYDRDLGELYLRIATNPQAGGLFHANDHGDERVNDLVEAIAGHVNVPPSVRRVPLAEAQHKLGPLADALVLDQFVRSTRARELGWMPALHSVGGNVPRLFEEWRRGRAA